MKRTAIALFFCIYLACTGTAQADELTDKIKLALVVQYADLVRIKQSTSFELYGFGGGYADAKAWQQKTTVIRDAAEKIGNKQLQNAAINLLMLGFAYHEARTSDLASTAKLSEIEEKTFDLRFKVVGALM